MATKTFKIGECAVGGIIKVTTTTRTVTVSIIDWDTKKPLEGHTRTFAAHKGHFNVRTFLEDMTTFYWTDNIMKWLNDHSTHLAKAEPSGWIW